MGPQNRRTAVDCKQMNDRRQAPGNTAALEKVEQFLELNPSLHNTTDRWQDMELVHPHTQTHISDVAAKLLHIERVSCLQSCSRFIDLTLENTRILQSLYCSEAINVWSVSGPAATKHRHSRGASLPFLSCRRTSSLSTEDATRNAVSARRHSSLSPQASRKPDRETFTPGCFAESKGSASLTRLQMFHRVGSFVIIARRREIHASASQLAKKESGS